MLLSVIIVDGISLLFLDFCSYKTNNLKALEEELDSGSLWWTFSTVFWNLETKGLNRKIFVRIIEDQCKIAALQAHTWHKLQIVINAIKFKKYALWRLVSGYIHTPTFSTIVLEFKKCKVLHSFVLCCIFMNSTSIMLITILFYL